MSFELIGLTMEAIEILDTVFIKSESKFGTVVDVSRTGTYTVEYIDDRLSVGVEGKHILYDCMEEDLCFVHKGPIRVEEKSDGFFEDNSFLKT